MRIGLVFALIVSTAALAKSPYRTPGQVLLEAKTLALLRVVDGRTFERVEAIEGSVPARLEVDPAAYARPPKWRAGELIIAPLVQVNGRWAVTLSTRAPIRVDPGSVRAAVRFVRGWRERGGEASDASLLGLLQDPAPLARKVALGELRRGRAGDAPAGLVAEMVAVLEAPGLASEDRRSLVRVVGYRGGDAGVVALADAWRTLATDRVRTSAAGVFARSKHPAAQRALVRCAESERGALRTRCLRILARRATR